MSMSPEDLSACYRENHRRLYLAALAITLDRQSAEDAVHDALENLLRGRIRPANLLAYAMRAVRNAAIDVARHRRRVDMHRETVFVSADQALCEITPATLTAAFGELRIDEREAILLHLYADMSFQEIAQIQKRSINTVASWYRRGVARLQEILEVNNGRN